MPPKKPVQATGSKKTQEKKKEKIIEVKQIPRVSMSVFSVSCTANVQLLKANTGADKWKLKLLWPLDSCQYDLLVCRYLRSICLLLCEAHVSCSFIAS